MKKHELPNSAKRIILAVLENDLRISTEAMLKIVEREAGKATDDMERQFRQAKCRRLMAGIRDREGRRMVFHGLRGEAWEPPFLSASGAGAMDGSFSGRHAVHRGRDTKSH